MKKNQKIIAISVLLLIGLLGASIYFFTAKSSAPSNAISANVTNVIDVPNRAEDGYRAIVAKDSLGQEYTINTTGYLNTPLQPEERGEACVAVPDVKSGDTISFNLPRSESSEANQFDICHDRGQTEYFLKKSN